MPCRKRGQYFAYLNESNVNIPRQTLFNKKKKQRDRKQRNSKSNGTQYDNVQSVSDISVISNNDSYIQSDSCDTFVEMESVLQSEINESIVNNETFVACESDTLNETDLTDTLLDDTVNSIDEHEQTKRYSKQIHDSIECTVIDAYRMIYAYSVRHELNWTQTEDLARLINSIIGKESLNPSKYMFKKIFRSDETETTVHFFCHVCDKYLGQKGRFNATQCPNCQIEIRTNTKYEKNHFITMPIENQLKNALERNAANLIFERESNAGEICDVHDSQHFQRLKNEMENESYITLTLYTDGAAVFKKTKDKSLWPICVYINEINLTNRFKRQNILCSAIAFGKTPNMQTFFRPLIEEIQAINSEGGIQFCDKNGQLRVVKVVPMIFTADALAKSDVLNLTHHNGYYGCPYCLHSGTHIQGTTQIRYCKRHNAVNRKNEQARKDMERAHKTATVVNGYKGLSPLLALGQSFDIVWQTVIDKMHCVDLGVIKKMFDLFLTQKYRNESFYIGDRLHILDRRMNEIRMPRLIRRNLRPLSQREHYHAYEWKFILLFVAYPLLKGVLPDRYFLTCLYMSLSVT